MVADATSPLPVSAYQRAERMLAHHRARLAPRARVRPHWVGDGDTFWYRVETERGGEFVLAAPDRGERRAAFDHDRLAAALADASGAEAAPYDLPFRAVDLDPTDDGDTVGFDAFDARWTCRLDDYTCTRDDARGVRSPLEVESPDGRWLAFRRDHDVWVRDTETGDERALTTDGEAGYGYAVGAESASARHLLGKIGLPEGPPALAWSPDSTRVLTHRTDERHLPVMPLVEAAPPDGGRPRLHTYRYAIPGDPVARGEWVVLDVPNGTATPARAEPFDLPYLSPLTLKHAWWSDDGASVYYLRASRDRRTLALCALDPVTGEVRTLVEETGETRVEPAQELATRPMVHVLPGGHEALWYSQRDGWGHLYLYDVDTGELQGQVTKGTFAVQAILHVDADERQAYLVVSGLADDPYLRAPVRVPLDGGELVRLTDDDLDHAVTAPDHGRWFVDTASTVATAPVTTVRGRDGAVLLELERADLTPLLEAGWTPPERIRTLAADGETYLYGVLHKPYGLDEAQRYPVLDHPYPGPQTRRVPASFDGGFHGPEADAAAALGFAVVAIDGRGTPGRHKAFHDHSYRDLANGGALDDHVAALRQLAGTRPWLDLDRVGIFGHSGGGFATVRAMGLYPDVYRVGVAVAGNHDNRFYHALWAETYDGPPDDETYARTSNVELAERVTGKLMLVHGEMDDNVTPHLTMRVVDRLVAANKDFELLIVPGAEHGLVGYQFYVTRRRWDFLVRHLMHREPPAGYRIADIPVTPETLETLFG